MNRRPVGIGVSTYGGVVRVVCNDGAVFFLNENGDGSLTWKQDAPIPGTLAAGAEQEKEPAESALEAFNVMAQQLGGAYK